MTSKPFAPSSAWFAAFVSLLVALGAEVLVGSIVPFDVVSWFSDGPSANRWHRAGDLDLWVISVPIRLVSFGMGAFVATLLTRRLSRSLVVMLLVIAALATVFAQFPSRYPTALLVLWALAAPIGVLVGLGLARLRYGVA